MLSPLAPMNWKVFRQRNLLAIRKPIERCQGLEARHHLAQIDLGGKESDLVRQSAFFDIDVPGARATIATITPSVSAALKRVFKMKGDCSAQMRTVFLRACSRRTYSAGAPTVGNLTARISSSA